MIDYLLNAGHHPDKELSATSRRLMGATSQMFTSTQIMLQKLKDINDFDETIIDACFEMVLDAFGNIEVDDIPDDAYLGDDLPPSALYDGFESLKGQPQKQIEYLLEYCEKGESKLWQHMQKWLKNANKDEFEEEDYDKFYYDFPTLEEAETAGILDLPGVTKENVVLEDYLVKKPISSHPFAKEYIAKYKKAKKPKKTKKKTPRFAKL